MNTQKNSDSVNKFTSLKYWFLEYTKDHMNPSNIRTHYLGVPLVTLSLLGIINSLNFDFNGMHINVSLIFLTLSLIWYFILDKKLAAMITIPIFTIYYISTLLTLKVNIAIQVVGWIFQLIGHYKFEGRSPAFLKSLPQLLIGPLFMFAKTINYNWNKKVL